MTKVKARALREIALAELEEHLPSVDKAARSPEQVVGELTRIYGVGSWTAQLAVAMVSPDFPLGPVGDLAVVRGLVATLKLGEGEARRLAKQVLEKLPNLGGLVLYLVTYIYEAAKT